MGEITRDKEIKNKLTITRGEGCEDNGEKMGKGLQGTYIKDTWWGGLNVRGVGG